MRTLSAFLFSVGLIVAAEAPVFFAMDTAARLEPVANAQLLADLGYAGLGGRPATAKTRAAGYRGPYGFQGYGIKLEPKELLKQMVR